MTFIKPLLGVVAFLAVPFETSAQSVQDLVNEALKIPQVRDAMRGRVPQARRARDPRILEIQTLLNARGFNTGTPDGITGPGTRRAIVAFQQSINHSTTGIITEKELAILRSDAGPASPTPAAKTEHSEPADVRTIQSILTDLGYDPGPVDGAWGKRSQTALDQFRRDQNSSEGGRPTSEDMALLQSALPPESILEEPPAIEDAVTKPTLFALPIVDRGVGFWVAWDTAPSEVQLGFVPLWSDRLPDERWSGPQPVRLRAPDKPGLYHIVMIDVESAQVVARLSQEIR